MSDDFMECDTCRAKPGTPPLCEGCLHNQALIARLRRADWIPIETAPRDGSRVHLGFAHMQNWDVIGHWQVDHWAHGTQPEDRFYGRPEPTHWRSLPIAPKAPPDDR